MPTKLSRLVLVTVAILFCLAISSAQTPNTTPDKRVEAIKEKVVKVGIGKKLTVTRTDGTNIYGSLISHDATALTMNDIDRQVNVVVGYDQIRSVEKGYGERSPVTGQRVSPKTRKIAGFAVLGALAVIFIIVLKGLSDPNF